MARRTSPKECLDLQDALCIADEGCRDKVDLLFYAKSDILSVLIGNGRQAHRHIWHIDAFALPEFSAIDYGTDDLLAFLFLYFSPIRPSSTRIVLPTCTSSTRPA